LKFQNPKKKTTNPKGKVDEKKKKKTL